MSEEKGWSIQRNYLQLPWQINWASGRFYSFPLAGALTTFALSTSILYSQPMYVPNPSGVTITSLGIEVTTNATGTFGRCALYEYVDEGLVGQRVVDSGAFLLDTNAYKSGSVSKFVPQGWYLMLFCATGGASVRGFSSTTPVFAGGVAESLDISTSNWSIRVTLTTSIVSDYVTNGFPLRISNNPQFPLSVVAGTNAPRLIIGI